MGWRIDLFDSETVARPIDQPVSQLVSLLANTSQPELDHEAIGPLAVIRYGSSGIRSAPDHGEDAFTIRN